MKWICRYPTTLDHMKLRLTARIGIYAVELKITRSSKIEDTMMEASNKVREWIAYFMLAHKQH